MATSMMTSRGVSMSKEFIEREAKAVAYRKLGVKLLHSAIRDHDLAWLSLPFCGDLCNAVGLGVDADELVKKLQQTGPLSLRTHAKWMRFVVREAYAMREALG